MSPRGDTLPVLGHFMASPPPPTYVCVVGDYVCGYNLLYISPTRLTGKQVPMRKINQMHKLKGQRTQTKAQSLEVWCRTLTKSVASIGLSMQLAQISAKD